MFKDMRIVDNFYQTSSFFPMPTIMVGTLNEDGSTNLGSYSLCFPYYVAGKDYYAMILECRNNSNTAQNMLRTKQCSLNFIPDDRKYFKEAVRLGFPGEASKDKMNDCLFTLTDGMLSKDRPKIIAEAFQVFECTWDDSLEDAYENVAGNMEGYPPPYRNFNGITSEFGAHFILKVEKILMKEPYYSAIINGVKTKDFPSVPVDYGYRDSTHFWYSRSKKPIAEPIPAGKESDLQSVMYAANRADPEVKFTEEACAMLTKVPRIFLKAALRGCVEYAKEHGITLLTAEDMEKINDKRGKEKGH